MLKKTLLACLLISSSLAVHAADFAPFGIKIGEQSSFYPKNLQPTVLEPVKVQPPQPVEDFFNEYNVYFNDDQLVRKVEASGDLTSGKYSCVDIANSLNDTFLKTYKNAQPSVQNGAMYAYTVEEGTDSYSAYIACDETTIHYVMFNPALEKIRDNVESPKKVDVQL